MKQIAKFSFTSKSKTCPKDPQFNISTVDRLWDAILKVWNINNDSGVSEKRIKEDILNWVVSIDKIIEANGVVNQYFSFSYSIAIWQYDGMPSENQLLYFVFYQYKKDINLSKYCTSCSPLNVGPGAYCLYKSHGILHFFKDRLNR